MLRESLIGLTEPAARQLLADNGIDQVITQYLTNDLQRGADTMLTVRARIADGCAELTFTPFIMKV